MQRKHPEARPSRVSSDAATHEDQQVALPPQLLNLYSKDTRASKAAPINFLAEPDDDEVPLPPQQSTSTVKHSGAKANFEKKVAYPLRPIRSQFKPAAASSEQSPRAASIPDSPIIEAKTPKENAPTSPNRVPQLWPSLFQEPQTTIDVEGHRPAGLLTIPPEIRNQIYDLVAAPEVGVVNLLTARAPTKPLKFVCRQIYNEVRHLHKAAHRSYWRDTQFTISPAMSRSKRICTSADIANIRHIYFEFKLSWVMPELSSTPSDKTAVYERWADGRWYELTLDGVPFAHLRGSTSQHWCIAARGEDWADCGGKTEFFFTTSPMATGTQWREITIGELNLMMAVRYK
ncbi:hypothetical protein LTR17_006476 [Elasticomyces elasticus]|nr:hypothetical protein LTR17_006476 [Elasticomyces elasticus]